MAFFDFSTKSSVVGVHQICRKIMKIILPARRSNFSLPLSLVTSMTSPVPRAPCLPLRRTSARAVVGLSPFSFRLVWFLTFVETCRGPTGTRSREVDEGTDLVMGFGGMADEGPKKGRPRLIGALSRIYIWPCWTEKLKVDSSKIAQLSKSLAQGWHDW